MAAATAPIAPGVATHAAIVTPGTVTYNPPLTQLWIGTTGSLVVTMANSVTPVTLSSVPAGTMLTNLNIVNVGTTTSAGSIVGFF